MTPFRSIRVRLTLWYIALIAVMLAAFGTAIYVALRHSLSTGLNDSLEVRGEELLASIHLEGTAPTLAGAVPGTGPPDGEQFIRVFDASGAITFDNGAPSVAPTERDALASVLAGQTITHSLNVGDATFRVRILPIQRDEQVLGMLEVGHSEDDIKDTLRTLLLILGISYSVTLVIASAGGLFLAGRALAPVDQLTRVARRISAEDLGERLALDLPDDELGRLAQTFDEMLERLDRAFQQQRQFTADASHELRTPLTAIKGQVEVALSRPRSVEDYRHVLGSVNHEVDRLIRLMSSLLMLARADAGHIPLQLDTVEASDLLAESVEHVEQSALARGVTLRVVAGPGARVNVDEGLLLQLLLNLLDNALKFTPPGGHVTAGWTVAGTNVEFYVQDDGPGVPEEDLSHVFDRFYRVDKVRGSTEGGAGLGLSISKWIAEAHEGRLTVTNATTAGARFAVTLPMGPAAEPPRRRLRAVL